MLVSSLSFCSISLQFLLHLLQQMPLTSTDLIICKGRTGLWRFSCGLADQIPSRSGHGPTCGVTAVESYSDSRKFKQLSVSFSFQKKARSHIRKWSLWLYRPNPAVALALLLSSMKFWHPLPWLNPSCMQKGRFESGICPRDPHVGSRRNSTDQFQMNCRPSLKRWMLLLQSTIECCLRLQGLVTSHWIKPSVCKTDGPSKVGPERFNDLSQFLVSSERDPNHSPVWVRVCSWFSRCISAEAGTRADNNANILAGLRGLLRCRRVPTGFMMFYAQNSVFKAPPAWMQNMMLQCGNAQNHVSKGLPQKDVKPSRPMQAEGHWHWSKRRKYLLFHESLLYIGSSLRA